MGKVSKRIIFYCGLAILICFSFGCTKQKFVIPTYDTAEEQYFYAMKMKINTVKGLDEEARTRQLRRFEAAFGKIIDTFPDDMKYTPAAYINLGDAYLEYDQPAKALKIFQTAIDKYPGQEDIQLFGHYGMGVAYDKTGKYSEAKKEYKYCIDKFGDDPRSSVKNIIEKAQFRYSRIREE